MSDDNAIVESKGDALTSATTQKDFQQGVDTLLSNRKYFIENVQPHMKLGKDYHIIKGQKALAKGGAEKLASIYILVATFEKDNDTLEMLGSPKGTLAYICTLTKNGEIVGQGRGADTVARNQNDPNKAIKMTEKRAYIDAVIRTTGLSDIFTQDLEQGKTAPANTVTSAKPEAKATPATEKAIKDVVEKLGHDWGAFLKHCKVTSITSMSQEKAGELLAKLKSKLSEIPIKQAKVGDKMTPEQKKEMEAFEKKMKAGYDK